LQVVRAGHTIVASTGRAASRGSGRYLEEEIVELHHLRYFVSVADEGSFGRAAERLHTSVSAVSRGVKRLETMLGRELFVRGYHEIVLTDAGEALLRRARPALAEVDRIRREFTVTDAGQGRFVIGIVSVLDPSLTTGVIDAVRSVWPERAVEVRVIRGWERRSLLAAGEIDAAIGLRPMNESDRESIPIATMRRCIAVRRSHEFAERADIDAAELTGLRLWVLSEGGCWTTRPPSGISASYILDDNISTIASRVMLDGDPTLIGSPSVVPAARVFDGAEFAVIPIRDQTSEVHLFWEPGRARHPEFAILLEGLRGERGSVAVTA